MATRDIQKYRNWRWWTITLRGVAAILFGVLALASPATALKSLVLLFGIYAIADGVLAFALGGSPLVSTAATYAHGLLSIAAGVITLVVPQVTAVALALLIGAWAIVTGILEIVMAIRLRHEIKGEWLLGIEGALSVAFGVMLFVSPLIGALVLALWVGAYALVMGGMLVGNGLHLRSVERSMLPGAMPAVA